MMLRTYVILFTFSIGQVFCSAQVNASQNDANERVNRLKAISKVKAQAKAKAKTRACVMSFSDSRSSTIGTGFRTYRPAVHGSEDGFVGTTKQIPLTSENILKAYQNGLFPWNPEANGIVKWYNPKWHGLAELEPLVRRVGPRFDGLRGAWGKVYKNNWTITFNRSFRDVIEACASHVRPNYSHVWLTPEVQKAFIKLHKEGFAHSVEVWDSNGNLIGGTYGILHRGNFSAESMFHNVSDAGKVAILALAERLYHSGHRIVDTQTLNDNTRKNFMAWVKPRNEYLAELKSESKMTFHIPSLAIFPPGVYSTQSNGGLLVPVGI